MLLPPSYCFLTPDTVPPSEAAYLSKTVAPLKDSGPPTPQTQPHSPDRYTLPEDVPEGHVTLSSPMIPSDNGALVYDFVFDAAAEQ